MNQDNDNRFFLLAGSCLELGTAVPLSVIEAKNITEAFKKIDVDGLDVSILEGCEYWFVLREISKEMKDTISIITAFQDIINKAQEFHSKISKEKDMGKAFKMAMEMEKD